MKLIITGRHVEVPKSFTQYVRKRFKKWATFLGNDASVHVVLNVEGYRHTVEITAKNGPYTATGKQTTKDMFRSVDLLAEKIGTQLSRQHERVTRKKLQPRRAEKNLLLPPERTVDRRPKIEIETITGKPMTHEEAALQLQALRTPFFIFQDIETEQIAVMVRQSDGTFKLIVKE